MAGVMPSLGYGTVGTKGRAVPSQIYFDLSTWHRINLLYVPKFSSTLRELRAFFADPRAHQRLVRVIEQRLGHDLLGRTEATKIALKPWRTRISRRDGHAPRRVPARASDSSRIPWRECDRRCRR